MFMGGKEAKSPSPEVPADNLGANVVKITSSGFEPSEIRIKVGDAVDFVNKDSSPHWPASAKHPTHEVYPEKGGCIGSKFDACKGLEQGEVFSFTFNHEGEWAFHDHLNPNLFGKVIVEAKTSGVNSK